MGVHRCVFAARVQELSLVPEGVQRRDAHSLPSVDPEGAGNRYSRTIGRLRRKPAAPPAPSLAPLLICAARPRPPTHLSHIPVCAHTCHSHLAPSEGRVPSPGCSRLLARAQASGCGLKGPGSGREAGWGGANHVGVV